MTNSTRVVGLIWTLAVPLIICLAISPGLKASKITSECDVFSSEAIADCLAEGDKFISAYVKKRLEKRRGRKSKSYHTCRSFQKFEECIKPIIDGCQEVKHDLSHHWQPVIDTMTSYCGDDVSKTENSIKAVNCTEEEYDSVFSYQCDQYYDFNIQQGTRHICHFVHENLHCKEALVASACGTEAGLFSFHLLKLHSDQNLAEMGISKCHVTKDVNYKGLRYDKHNCPRDMVGQIDRCSNLYLTDDMIVDFRQESDVIIQKEDRRKLTKACSARAEYNICIKSIKEACPHGAKTIFDYAEPLKKYLLKMDMICQHSTLEVYQKNVKCMNNEVLDNNALSQCDHLWQELAKVKRNVTSFQFYCDATHQSARALMSELHNLRSCYRGVFEATCPGTGDLIEKLLQRVFQDPVYLRFNFKPDCVLHRMGPDATMNDAEMPNDDANSKSTPTVPSPTYTYHGSEKIPYRTSTRKPSPTYRERDKVGLKPGSKREQSTNAKSLSVSSQSSISYVSGTVFFCTLSLSIWLSRSIQAL